MNYIKKVCSFTGYRPKKLTAALSENNHTYDELKKLIIGEIDLLIDEGFEIFQCGMAEGSDLLFAEMVLEFKKRYPFIRLNAFIPCQGQSKGWSENSRIKYDKILSSCDEARMISDTPYFEGCMQKRNLALVDTCDMLLGIFHGQSGGTKQTIEYAKKKKIKTVVIDPQSFVKITLHT